MSCELLMVPMSVLAALSRVVCRGMFGTECAGLLRVIGIHAL